MTGVIDLPKHCVILIVGPSARHGDMALLADAVSGASAPWDVDSPDASLARLQDALRSSDRVRVVMTRSHAKARRAVSTAARKRGAAAVVLALPGSPEIGSDEGHLAVHAVHPDRMPSFRTVPMPCDRSDVTCPLDLIGDVHGCADELVELLVALGHADPTTGDPIPHPTGRRTVLLGDLTDRGPQNLRVLRIARRLDGIGGLRVLGNHDEKLSRWLAGRNVRISAGLAETVSELERLPETERADISAWIGSAQTHLILDGGRLLAAHAGLDLEHHGRMTPGARSFALYGKTTGALDADGRPEAEDWAVSYAGRATVVHGHVVHPEPRIVGDVVAIDTGCVFGGRLTAYRWPERTLVSVPSRQPSR